MIRLLCFALVWTLASCSTLVSDFRSPTVNLISVEPAGAQGLSQLFRVGLKIGNPNQRQLTLVGANYELALEGFDVISGVANDLPNIDAYASEMIYVDVALGLIEGLQLVNHLMSKQDGKISYQLNLNLDTGLPVIGKIPLVEKGTFDINELVSNDSSSFAL
jgi:LEA14-like dessication related protein